MNATLYALGCDPKYWYSRGTVSATTDGSNWQSIANPFLPEKGFSRLAAYNGTDSWITFSNFGQCAISTDAVNWSPYNIEDKQWLVTKVKWINGEFWITGHEKNPENLDETAFIAYGSGVHAGWRRIWISSGRNGVLYDLKFINDVGPLCFSVGVEDNLATPLLVVSEDSGAYWQPFPTPANWQGPIYSCEYNSTSQQLLIGGKGQIATTTWAGTASVWSINDRIYTATPKPISQIKWITVGGINLVTAISGGDFWYSFNAADWSVVSQPGYQFTDLVVFNDQIWLGCTGTLNQYTGFVGTLNVAAKSIVLTGFNNGVQSYSWIIA